jgi:hypothetical protein
VLHDGKNGKETKETKINKKIKEITVLWLQRLVFSTNCRQGTNVMMTYWDFGHRTH